MHNGKHGCNKKKGDSNIEKMCGAHVVRTIMRSYAVVRTISLCGPFKEFKKLKQTCGTGGTVVGEVIEIQGDKREEIKSVLEKEGFKVKFIGG